MAVDARLKRAQRKIEILEKMIENRTREVFVEQAQMRKTRDYFASIVESVQNALIVLNEKLEIVSVNSAAVHLLEASRTALAGADFQQYLGEEKLVDALTGTLFGETILQREAKLKNSNGVLLPVLFSATLLKSDDLAGTEVLCVAVDIREKTALESQLLQAQKLESIGQLAAGIAHEINTPIQFVGDNTRFLKDSFRELQTALESLRNGTATSDSLDAAEIDFLSSEIPRAIEQTLEGVSRVSTIVRAMKEFAHPGSDKKQAVDINRLIESTSIVSTNEWKYAAEMSLVLDRNLPLVPCHAAELNQAVLNLIVNAAHAIAEKSGAKKGKITVSTSLDGDYGVISVADTGAGIPDAIAPKVFDPFFTTKPIGKGTGQGLSMTRSIIVERHGGMIGFRTVPGEGTTFNIHLPLTA